MTQQQQQQVWHPQPCAQLSKVDKVDVTRTRRHIIPAPELDESMEAVRKDDQSVSTEIEVYLSIIFSLGKVTASMSLWGPNR
jgi:hypothetical protein